MNPTAEEVFQRFPKFEQQRDKLSYLEFLKELQRLTKKLTEERKKEDGNKYSIDKGK